MLSGFSLRRHELQIGSAHQRVAGVDLESFPRFRIDEARDPDVGDQSLAGILDAYGDDIVTLRKQLERMIDVRLEEIGDDEYDCVLVQHPCDVINGGHHVRSTANRLERQKIANY